MLPIVTAQLPPLLSCRIPEHRTVHHVVRVVFKIWFLLFRGMFLFSFYHMSGMQIQSCFVWAKIHHTSLAFDKKNIASWGILKNVIFILCLYPNACIFFKTITTFIIHCKYPVLMNFSLFYSVYPVKYANMTCWQMMSIIICIFLCSWLYNFINILLFGISCELY